MKKAIIDVVIERKDAEITNLRTRLDAEHAARLEAEAEAQSERDEARNAARLCGEVEARLREAEAKLAEAVVVVKGFVGLVSWKDLNDPEFSDYQTALMKRAAALLENKP